MWKVLDSITLQVYIEILLLTGAHRSHGKSLWDKGTVKNDAWVLMRRLNGRKENLHTD